MITLEKILAAKEARQQRQQYLRQQYGQTLISITINMPGPVKDTPRTRELADFAANQIKLTTDVAVDVRHYLPTGPEIMLIVSDVAGQIKSMCMDIEESADFTRLLDLDVFDAGGTPFSRQAGGKGRGCLVCSDLAVTCMRERRHSLEEVRQAAGILLDKFSAHQTRLISPVAEKIGALAVEAMLFEVTATPAPGLVDRSNSGAHTDMDFYSFMASTAALSYPMARCAQAGCNYQGKLPGLLTILRYVGLAGEKAMLAATGGVNTQKGLLFSLGITAAAAGWLSRQCKQLTAQAVLDIVADITAGIVDRELKQRLITGAELTAGERLYRDHGITGIRGEMEQGLPIVREHALPALRSALGKGLSINDALIDTLLSLYTCVEDTTVMNRCGLEKMRVWVRDKAQSALDAGGMANRCGRELVMQLDQECITHNISPGGAADLLAVTWFVHKLEEATDIGR